jgi:Protein of unknown function (DUF1822)
MIQFADPKEWWLELSPQTQTTAATQSQPLSTPANRRRAYLNALGLNAVLAWIREEGSDARSLPPMQLPTVWEVVNGTVIQLGTMRIVLIPTENIDNTELEVPQEWMDNPNWAGDYFLAVQVKPESGWVRIWGYATHQDLKSIGHYDATDRTYTLDAEHLTQDLNAFWLTTQFCATEQTQTAIAPLPELSDIHAEQLIQRLGNPAIVFPRLTIPFSLWAALLSRQEWLQVLYERRCGLESRPEIVNIVKLSTWLQGQFQTAWQAVDTILLPTQLATAWRSTTRNLDDRAEQDAAYLINRVKVLDMGERSPSGNPTRTALLIGMNPINDTQMNLGLYICPLGESVTALQDIQVRLLDGDGTEVGQASAAMTETIQFQFSGQVGEFFSVVITIDDRTLTEAFEI